MGGRACLHIQVTMSSHPSGPVSVNLSSAFSAIVILVWVMTGTTWFVHQKLDRYMDKEPQLLVNPSFSQGSVGWSMSTLAEVTDEGVLVLDNPLPGSSRYAWQMLKAPSSGYLRICAEADIRNVQRGPEVWHKARVDVLGREPGGDWKWDFPNTLFSVTGTVQFVDYCKVIPVPESYPELRVEAELTGGTGVFRLNGISAREARPRDAVVHLSRGLLAGWILLGAAGLFMLLRKGMVFSTGVALFALGLLVWLPESVKHSLLDGTGLGTATLGGLPLDHLLLVFPASWMVLYESRWRGMPFLPVLILLVTFAVSTECIQYYSNHRNPQLLDAVANLVAIGFSVFLFRAVPAGTRWITRKPG